MKYCWHCGNELCDEAVVCTSCGCGVNSVQNTGGGNAKSDTQETLEIVTKVFMILGCISIGWVIVPLAWCIPMTVSVFNSIKTGRPIGTGMKVCVLLFVNVIAGICLLCMDEN